MKRNRDSHCRCVVLGDPGNLFSVTLRHFVMPRCFPIRRVGLSILAGAS